MEDAMNELIEVVKMIKFRDAWDYAEIIISLLSTTISLLLSGMAIFISTRTANRQNTIGERQNEIALFEPRYKAFNILNFLLPVARIILDKSKQKNTEHDTWDILASSMQTYMYSTSPFEINIDYRQLKYFYTNLILELGALECLFHNENIEQITSFLYTFRDLVSNVCEGKTIDKEMVLLENYVNQIDENGVIEKLEKHLKL